MHMHVYRMVSLPGHVCVGILMEHTHPHTHTKEDGSVLDLDRSSELLLFHEAVNNLVESEEQLIEEHKSIIQADQYLLEEEAQLLQYVGEVDHDIEREGTQSTYVVCKRSSLAPVVMLPLWI